MCEVSKTVILKTVIWHSVAHMTQSTWRRCVCGSSVLRSLVTDAGETSKALARDGKVHANPEAKP